MINLDDNSVCKTGVYGKNEKTSLNEEKPLDKKEFHATYKILFILIMTYAFTNCFNTIEKQVNPLLGCNLIVFGILFIVYIFVFTRFLLGILRYLDTKYIQIDQYDKECALAPTGSNPVDKHSLHRAFDFFFIILHGILFCILSAVICDSFWFCVTLMILLLINCVWLWLSFTQVAVVHRQNTIVKNTTTWVYNNIFCSYLLLVIVGLFCFNKIPNDIFTLGVIVIGLSNSIYDICLTFDTYFPRIC
jgi:hypothetical protein